MILSPSRTLLVSVPQAGGSQTIEGLSFAEVQRKHILAVLERSNWRVRGPGGAAELLELKPTTLEYKMKKLHIRRQS